MANLVFIAVLAPFALMLPMAFLGRRLGPRTGWLALIAPVVSCACIAWLSLGASPGAQTVAELTWIPSLGLNLTFLVDGLALFFGLVVSGVGVLVVFYSTQYLDDHYRHHGRFYTFLLLFMGSMLGTVFAGNLLLMFVFWELTGITSFLLIGFLHEKEESRVGARMALLVTAGTGLVMMAGIILLGLQAGTFDLAALLAGPIEDSHRTIMTAAFVLVAVGAFGKSAQFPFQFWLPNAMAAPTPVSAYLHSATMVKLGVYLVARIFPIFREVELWAPLLLSICLITVVLAAILSLLSHDLKAILAYTTVAQLGSLIAFYGLAPPAGASGDLFQIANHVFYKGCLFMVVGIIDHSAHERDVRRLGGLAKSLPLLAGITLVASASMAGIPGTLGFVSKEFLLADQWLRADAGGSWSWMPLAVTTFSALLSVAVGARIFFGVFLGRATPATEHAHAPGFLVQLAPLVLAGACLGFGLFPDVLGQALQQLGVRRLHAMEELHFAIWHGLTRELWLSAGILAVGLALYWLMDATRWRWAVVPRILEFERAFEAGVEALPHLAKKLTALLRSDRPFDFLPIIITTFLAVVGGYLVTGGAALRPAWPEWTDFDGLRSFVVALIAAAVVFVVWLRRWTGQLIALSIVGFLITFYFVLFRAPDLAMTQILVETATLLLVLLLLARFPRSAEQEGFGRQRRVRRIFALVLSVGVGGVTTWLALLGLSPRATDVAGDYYLRHTVELAHGTNTVNTILVDFRGFDTLLEVTVLLIASLGAAGLFMRYRRTQAEYAAGPMGPAGFGTSQRRTSRREVRR
jgi:NADH:ubiquinone oxidoreductase subunit 5 (subunit L)/multisubunit Na+/H+ antiporter MnhA subunit